MPEPNLEASNLCETCKKLPECLKKGIFHREVCSEYDSLSIDELLERDRFISSVMVGACPKCGGTNTYDCENNPLLEDNTVGHCLDCETYWCLECGFIFQRIEKGATCPHWAICDKCSKEHGYLDLGTFIEEVCPMCEHYDNGCQLEDPSKCDKEWRYLCPYEHRVSECPEIKEFLRKQM